MKKETKAGLYITVSIHLAVIIVLMLTVVNPLLIKGDIFEIDFSKQDEIEKLEEQLKKEEELNERLDRMLSEAGIPEESIRNVAVDRNSLKDDRGTNARQFNREVERLRKEFANGYDYDVGSSVADVSSEETLQGEELDKHEEIGYKGPATVIYYLEGRKATRLAVPAYKCYNPGEVAVGVTVDRNGKVIATLIIEDMSSDDPCLREYALKASRKSTFAKCASAPPEQIGSIIYQFLAQ